MTYQLLFSDDQLERNGQNLKSDTSMKNITINNYQYTVLH